MYLKSLKNQGKTIGFVPTMGALHKGHLSLIKMAKNQCDVVVCCIFVNPKQFNDAVDFDRYPRTVSSDIEKLKAVDCTVCFTPDKDDVYPENFTPVNYYNDYLFENLEGNFRPGHFKGVVTVVARLLEIVQPDKAYFGLKDYQQYLVIKDAVTQLNIKTEVIGLATVREPSGLAMSSRNALLSKEEAELASVIYRALLLANNKSELPEVIEKQCFDMLENAGLKTEYFNICSADNLKPIKNWTDAESYIAVTAVKLNRVRLIDNLLFS